MSLSNLNKELKPSFFSTNVTNSPAETETTIKKKIFARKPAYTNITFLAEKKKKSQEQSQQLSNIVPQQSRNVRVETQNVHERITNRKERLTQMFNKQTVTQTEILSKNSRQFFYSPKSQKQNIIGSLCFLQRKNNKKQSEYSFNEEENKQMGFNNTFSRTNQKQYTNKYPKIDDTFDDVNSGRWKYRANSTISLNNDSIKKQQSSSKQRSYNNFNLSNCVGDRQMALECGYCKNNKKIVDILNQKYSKLEQQQNQKLMLIKQLTDKCQNLKKQNVSLCDKLEKNIEQFHSQQMQFFKVKQDFMSRIQTLKKDIVKLNEKVKYLSMENNMLLRFKDQYQLITIQFDQIKHENDQMRRQIVQKNRAEHCSNFLKNKNKPVNLVKNYKQQHQKISNSRKQLSNGHSKSTNIYYDCDDDNISLNLSEHSQNI